MSNSSSGSSRTNTLALAVAVVALVLAVVSFLREPEQDAAPLDSNAALERRIDELERSVADLRRAPAVLTTTPIETPTDTTSPRTPVAREQPPGPEDLLRRVAALERQLAAREQAAMPTSLEALLAARLRRDRGDDKSVPEWQQVAIDRNRTEQDRLEALSTLRGRGPGARGEPVLSAMVELAQTSTDPKTRADVWRQMSGADEPGLVQPLLHAVLHDADAKAREEAAETLGDYVDSHPNVRAILRQVADNDADEKVRRQAGSSTAGRKR